MCCLPCIVIDCPTATAVFSQRPVAMPIKSDHNSSLLSRLAGWWRSRRSVRTDASNSARVAVEAAAPRVLAGKWPSAVNPFEQRLEQLNAFCNEPGRAQVCSPLVEGKA